MMRLQPSVFRTNWKPMREWSRMQGEVDRLFHNLNDSYAPGFPSVNISSNDDQAVVSAELPGIPSDKIDISVLDDTLTIKGTRELAARSEGTTMHRQERGAGKFSRSIRLPFRVESQDVDAKYENGVLEITLPRAAADRPQRIAVHEA